MADLPGVTAESTDTSPDKALAGSAADWLDVIKRSEAHFQKWRERSEKIKKIYYQQNREQDGTKRKYALLWANTEILKPTVYSRPPVPVVTRRFKDKDRVARETSEIWERSLIYTVDRSSFDRIMRKVRDDFLLVGRGVPWVRYEVDTAPLDQDDIEAQAVEAAAAKEPPKEKIVAERAVADYINWADFGHNIARTWPEVTAVWKRVFLTRDELVKRFGKEKGEAVTLDHKPDNAPESAIGDDRNKKATVYEIWCKASKKVYWVAKGSKDYLDEKPPLLEFDDFFPCPEPAYTTEDELKPIPDYVFYQDQAEQINDIIARNDKLVDSLKLVGFYPAGTDGTAAIETAIKPGTENVLVPVPGWAAFAERGGSNQIQWLPIDQVIKVLEGNYVALEKLVQQVYEITGLSDILRGASDPNETAAAQKIKTQWGGVRVRDKQGEIARVARDTLRLLGEIIADKFQSETLQSMTGKKLPTKIEVQNMVAQMMQQQAAQQAQQPMQPGQPPTPPPQPPDPDKLPVTIDDVMALLHDDRTRGFRIDVETDSTISTDEQADKEEWTELLGTLGQFMQGAVALGQQVPQFVPVIGEMLQTTVRKFRAGRQLEDTIETAVDALSQAAEQKIANPAPDPAMVKAQADAKNTEVKTQAELQKSNNELQMQREDHMHEKQSKSVDVAIKLMDHQHHMQKAAIAPQPAPRG